MGEAYAVELEVLAIPVHLLASEEATDGLGGFSQQPERRCGLKTHLAYPTGRAMANTGDKSTRVSPGEGGEFHRRQ